MEEVLLLIERNQTWIYLGLGLAAALYLRLALRWYGELQRSTFGLEKEQAIARLRRALALLSLVVTAAAATFVVATFVAPALPASGLPTPAPTVSLLSTPQPPGVAVPPDFVTASPLPEGTLDSSGCLNTEATLLQPLPGDSLSGVVEIRGTANIANFGFYKLEYRNLTGDTAWRAILAGDQPVIEDRLGEWDTSLVLPGEYAFQLVVADTAGNAPFPCVIPIRITAAP